MRLPFAVFAACLAMLTSARAEATALWSVVEDESEIAFIASQGGSPVNGVFQQFSAELTFDPSALADSRFRVEIDVDSVESGNGDRDSTLRSNGFFEVSRWPLALFEADDIRAVAEDRYEAHGTLTLRDQSLPVILPFTLELSGTPGERRAMAEGALTINRIDYGVGQGQWADTSVIADAVEIAVRIVALEQAP